MATSPTSPFALRPKRFPLRLPLDFRVLNGERWWRATTVNVSANGVLFRARKRLAPQTPLEVKMQLPPALTGDGTVRLLCSGYVVRSSESRLPFGRARIAATFHDFQLVNGKPGLTAEWRQAQLAASRTEGGRIVHRLNNLLSIMLGSADVVLLDPANQDNARNFALQTRQAAEEAAMLVRALAQMLK
jgi:hypothetical protein